MSPSPIALSLEPGSSAGSTSSAGNSCNAAVVCESHEIMRLDGNSDGCLGELASSDGLGELANSDGFGDNVRDSGESTSLGWTALSAGSSGLNPSCGEFFASINGCAFIAAAATFAFRFSLAVLLLLCTKNHVKIIMITERPTTTPIAMPAITPAPKTLADEYPVGRMATRLEVSEKTTCDTERLARP